MNLRTCLEAPGVDSEFSDHGNPATHSHSPASFPETLVTERLELRRMELSHAKPLLQGLFRHADYLQYMAYHPHTSLADTQAYIQNSRARWDSGDRKEYTVVHRTSGEILGVVGAYLAIMGRCSLGAAIGPAYGRQGFVRESVLRYVAYLQRQPWVGRIWAFAEGTNERSQYVLSSMGFIEEGVVHNWSIYPQLGSTPRDVIFYHFPKTPLVPESQQRQQPDGENRWRG